MAVSDRLWQPGDVGYLPSSLVTAISGSAAAGKNPWLPLALLCLIAQADRVPRWLMDPHLHRGLHGLAPPSVMLTLGIVFLVLSLAESFGDKVSWIEAWLTPISTTWRPFAAIAVATLVGVGTIQGNPGALGQEAVGVGLGFGFDAIPEEPTAWEQMSPYAWLVLCILAGTVSGLIATVGKTGTRLLLTLVPVPGLRLAHSFLDDFFAWGVTLAGLVMNDSLFMVVLGVLYLSVGLVVAPILGRLSLIQLKIFASLWRKLRAKQDDPPPKLPRWLKKALRDRDLSHVIPAYAYRTSETGLCRSGFLLVDDQGVVFAVRSWFRPKLLEVKPSELERLGLAETLTSRAVTLARSTANGGDELSLYLFPGSPRATTERLLAAAKIAGLVRVRPGSQSGRLAHERSQAGRFVPASEAGNLRTQAVLSLGAAIGVGVLSGGVFIPIGFGYSASPFKGRFVLGCLLSLYLAASVMGTFGFAWPIALLYAVVLNAIALRDLSRHALRAHLDGFVDRFAFLPNVPGMIWVTDAPAADHFRAGQADPVTDGSWRVVWRLLSDEPATA
ncbi:MAG: DUF4126 family protein [Polyangiaceae bacterium]|nr:DUF4126 family protein [Polyangiaceae bacterium]MCB9608070.1 DUF4126 family protein [Polyangiaceae bacterium]